MDITKLSMENLKAIAYDIKVQLEANQRNLNLVESEIERRVALEREETQPQQEVIKKESTQEDTTASKRKK